MSILINGMEMPTSCSECTIKSWDGEDDVCPFSGISALSIGRQDDCPLIPVPEHGDLIDRDAFLAEQRLLYCENCERRKGIKNGKMKFVYDIGDAPCRACGYGDVLDDIEDAPTIILGDWRAEDE